VLQDGTIDSIYVRVNAGFQASDWEVEKTPQTLAENTTNNVIPFKTLIPTEDRIPRVESPIKDWVPPHGPCCPQ